MTWAAGGTGCSVYNMPSPLAHGSVLSVGTASAAAAQVKIDPANGYLLPTPAPTLTAASN